MQKITQEQLNELIERAIDLRNISTPDSMVSGIFKDLNLTYLNFENVDLSNIRFDNCSLLNSTFKGVKFNNSNFRNCRFYLADLIDVDFSESIIMSTSFMFSRIININLTGAELRFTSFAVSSLAENSVVGLDKVASLFKVIGDGSVIRTFQFPIWPVTATSTHMQIGCQYHPIEKWEAFSDDEIDEMGEGAVVWWHRWKDTIINLINSPVNGKIRDTIESNIVRQKTIDVGKILSDYELTMNHK